MSDLRAIIQNIIASVIMLLAAWLLARLHRAGRIKKSSQKSGDVRQRQDDGRQKGQFALFIGCFCILALAVWIELLGPLLSNHFIYSDTTTLIRKPRWIAYDPLEFDPTVSSKPDVDLIDEELGWIQLAGFDGIITFTSRGTFDEIPKLAKEKHLAVIMGIWDPLDRQEIAAAISKQQYVDAYCVGHDGLNHDYSYDDLVKAINHVRFRTGRPVTTTEKIDHYLHDERLFTMGDWLFPDCLLPIRDKNTHTYVADPDRDVNETIKLANQLAAKVGQRDKKPVLLKMVGYPYPIDVECKTMAGDGKQAMFFRALTDAQQDVGGSLSTEVSISVYSAFDLTWKRGHGFYDWEHCTGLLNDNGVPRPAVQEIMKRRLR